MEYIVTALATGAFTLLFIFLYKYLINPQIVYSSSVENMSQCPDRWNYNSITKMCEPGYQTSCLSFDPKSSTLDSLAAKCNAARSCGTSWSGLCN